MILPSAWRSAEHDTPSPIGSEARGRAVRRQVFLPRRARDPSPRHGAVLGRFRRHWKRYAGMKGIRFPGGGANDGTRLSIELLEIAVNAPLAERDAPRRGEIGGNPRPPGDAVVQRDDARHLALEPLHP